MVLVGLIAASGSLFGGKNRWTGEGLAAVRARAAEAGMGKSKKFAAEEREREEQGADSFVPGCGEPLLEGHATGSGEVDSAARGEYAPPAYLEGLDLGRAPEPSAPPAEPTRAEHLRQQATAPVAAQPSAAHERHAATEPVDHFEGLEGGAAEAYVPGNFEAQARRGRLEAAREAGLMVEPTEENRAAARRAAGIDDTEEAMPSTAASASMVRARSERHATMAAMPARSGAGR